MINKKAQIQILFNPKAISFIIGGALIGYFLFQNVNATIIGGIVGFALSFVK